MVDPSLPGVPLKMVSPAVLRVSRTQREAVLCLRPGCVPKPESRASWWELAVPSRKTVRLERTVQVIPRWCSSPASGLLTVPLFSSRPSKGSRSSAVSKLEPVCWWACFCK